MTITQEELDKLRKELNQHEFNLLEARYKRFKLKSKNPNNETCHMIS